jgi:hypothetical protein
MDYIHNNSIFVTASALDLRTIHDYTVCGLRREVFIIFRMARAKWQRIHHEPFNPCLFPDC